jgi:surfeit locus 1 family protein
MRIGGFDFRPGLWPTLITLAVLPGLIGLGHWQLERADWKQSLVDSHAASAQKFPQPLADIVEAGGELEFRPVVVSGRYDLARQLLLDNRIYKGRAGYHVLTPVLLDGRKEAVLVNRGWLPMGQSRAVLPALPGPEQESIVTGTIARLPEKVFRLDSAEEENAGWPQVIQHVNFEDIERRLGYALMPVVILLDSELAHGFTRDWKPVYGTTPDKHRAYAMQWYTLAVVLLLIYIGVNTKRARDQ